MKVKKKSQKHEKANMLRVSNQSTWVNGLEVPFSVKLVISKS